MIELSCTGLLESATTTLIASWFPTAVGVPEILREFASTASPTTFFCRAPMAVDTPGTTVRPAGTSGITIVNGGCPPTMLIVWLYGSPTTAFGNVLILNDGRG